MHTQTYADYASGQSRELSRRENSMTWARHLTLKKAQLRETYGYDLDSMFRDLNHLDSMARGRHIDSTTRDVHLPSHLYPQGDFQDSTLILPTVHAQYCQTDTQYSSHHPQALVIGVQNKPQYAMRRQHPPNGTERTSENGAEAQSGSARQLRPESRLRAAPHSLSHAGSAHRHVVDAATAHTHVADPIAFQHHVPAGTQHPHNYAQSQVISQPHTQYEKREYRHSEYGASEYGANGHGHGGSLPLSPPHYATHTFRTGEDRSYRRESDRNTNTIGRDRPQNTTSSSFTHAGTHGTSYTSGLHNLALGADDHSYHHVQTPSGAGNFEGNGQGSQEVRESRHMRDANVPNLFAQACAMANLEATYSPGASGKGAPAWHNTGAPHAAASYPTPQTITPARIPDANRYHVIGSQDNTVEAASHLKHAASHLKLKRESGDACRDTRDTLVSLRRAYQRALHLE
jgi:hypothetical protein